MKPVFSIITVTYNAQKWIETTIKSVTEQTYDRIEYIVVDGNSSDGTVEIIKKYADKISKWVSEPDKGLYDAMNKGLKLATGDFVWFMNAGDTIYDDKTVSVIAEKIGEKFDNIVVYGETRIIDEKGRIVGARRLKIPDSLNWKSFRMGMLVSHQSFIPSRNIAPVYDLQYKYSADVDWCIRCLRQAEKTVKCGILSSYLNEGMTTANRNASLKERYKIMCKYYGTLPTMLRHLWFAVRFYWAKTIKGRV